MDDVASVARLEIVPSILEAACRATDMRFAAVARVTETRWIACAVRDEIAFGLEPGGELVVESTLCHAVRMHDRAVVIEHVATDPDYCHHHTPAQYGFQSYISVPILRRGAFFGTLCAIDPEPNRFKREHALQLFELLAELIGRHLEAEEQLLQSQSDLLDAQQTAELREQFIAVLGHDLRNPLNTLRMGLRALSPSHADEPGAGVLRAMQRSVARMAGLIENVLDFARTRLGDGVRADADLEPDICAALLATLDEQRIGWPHRRIDVDCGPVGPIRCDTARVIQLFGNLLDNALTHGDEHAPIRVGIRVHAGHFELSVANRGPTIPEPLRARLFQPFARTQLATGQAGLGLGLYIADTIARAHHGTLSVVSEAGDTCFVFSMPVDGPHVP